MGLDMARTYSKFVCQSCGYQSATSLGRCPTCGEFGTFVEEVVGKKGPALAGASAGKAEKLSEVKAGELKRMSSGIFEFDRVLGGPFVASASQDRPASAEATAGEGGIVPGSVVLIAGEPGMGKSTILLQLSFNLASAGKKVLYVSGEESVSQIKIRAERLGSKLATKEGSSRKDGIFREALNGGDAGENILILAETDTDGICAQINEIKPSLVIIDSIQTMTTAEMTGMAGSVGQVRESAFRLSQVAKSLSIPLFIVGHVTKEGAIAGPKVLEHLVDVVLYLEGDRTQSLRIVRGVKNRYGATDEVGVFEMTDAGLSEVSNPSELFLEERVKNESGSVVTVTMEGTRPVLVEVQALVSPTTLAIPRRVANGIDGYRLQLLTAILTRRLSLPLSAYDVFVNVASGFRITEPASDLAVCLAIISSYKDKAVSNKAVVFGEVGLLGEVRKVTQMERRIKEAKKLGFTRIVSPIEVKSLGEAVRETVDGK